MGSEWQIEDLTEMSKTAPRCVPFVEKMLSATKYF